MKLYTKIGLFLLGFTCATTLIAYVFLRKPRDDVEEIVVQPLVSSENITYDPVDNTNRFDENGTPFDDFVQPPNSFGSGTFRDINWSYFWGMFRRHSHWALQWLNESTDTWEFVNDSLIVSKNMSDNMASQKITLNFTAPYNGSYRLIFAIDKRARDFIYSLGNYTYLLNYSVGDNETYKVFFNFSDLMNIQNIDVTHGTNNNYLWLKIRKDNVPAGKTYELDPTFGTTATGSYAWSMYNTLFYTYASPATSGYADSITARIRLNTDGHREFIAYALYDADTGELVANTSEGIVGGRFIGNTWHWKTLWFQNGSEPYVYSDKNYAIALQSPCQTSSIYRVELHYRVATGNIGLETLRDYYSRWHDDLNYSAIVNYTTLNVSAYCTYTEDDNEPPDVTGRFPFNNSEDETQVDFWVNFTDDEGDNVEIYWYTNASNDPTWENDTIELRPQFNGTLNDFPVQSSMTIPPNSMHWIDVDEVSPDGDTTFVKSSWVNTQYCSLSDSIAFYEWLNQNVSYWTISPGSIYQTFSRKIDNNSYGNNFTMWEIYNLQPGYRFSFTAPPKSCLNAALQWEFFDVQENHPTWNTVYNITFHWVNTSVYSRHLATFNSTTRVRLSKVNLTVNYSWYKEPEWYLFANKSGLTNGSHFARNQSVFSGKNETYYWRYAIKDETGNLTWSEIWNFKHVPTWFIQENGWFTFGNTTEFDNITGGWATFGNETSYDNVSGGWYTFGNTTGFGNVTSGWFTFGNVTTWSDTTTGWFTFNAPEGTFNNISTGYFTFGNTSTYTNITGGYFTFGNITQYEDITTGYFTFGNISAGIFTNITSGYFTFGNETTQPPKQMIQRKHSYNPLVWILSFPIVWMVWRKKKKEKKKHA